MKSRWTRIAVSCLMILAIVAALSLSCGKKKEGVTIVIGNISDMTGPASTALIPINYALQDLAKYYNDNNLIPGVEFKVVTYDARYDPSLDIPGWDWVRGKGAKVVVTALPTTAQTLKSFAESAKTPLWSLTTSDTLINPPGWVFCSDNPTVAIIQTLLQWISISGNDPDFPTNRPAKVGSVGWQEPYAMSLRDGVKQYAQNHPDKFEWVGGFLAPMAAVTWTAEVQALKDCDYVVPPSTGTGMITFMKQYRDRGYDAKFLATDAHHAYLGLAVDGVGWADLDGTLAVNSTRWWNEATPIVDLAKNLLSQNHRGEASEVIHAGGGYIGSFHQLYAFYQVLQQVIANVGAENFDGQAFYDTAITFNMTWEGYEEWGFSQTKRYTWNYTGIYEWSAQAEDVVRKATDWQPLVLG